VASVSGIDASSTLICAGWLPQGRSVRLERFRGSRSERGHHRRGVAATHRYIAGRSQALPPPLSSSGVRSAAQGARGAHGGGQRESCSRKTIYRDEITKSTRLHRFEGDLLCQNWMLGLVSVGTVNLSATTRSRARISSPRRWSGSTERWEADRIRRPRGVG